MTSSPSDFRESFQRARVAQNELKASEQQLQVFSKEAPISFPEFSSLTSYDELSSFKNRVQELAGTQKEGPLKECLSKVARLCEDLVRYGKQTETIIKDRLCLAAERGSFQEELKLLQKEGVNVKLLLQGPFVFELFRKAMVADNNQLFLALVDTGANLHIKDLEGRSLFHLLFGSYYKDREIDKERLRVLLEQKVVFNEGNPETGKALDLAVDCGSIFATNLLLSFGAELARESLKYELMRIQSGSALSLDSDSDSYDTESPPADDFPADHGFPDLPF